MNPSANGPKTAQNTCPKQRAHRPPTVPQTALPLQLAMVSFSSFVCSELHARSKGQSHALPGSVGRSFSPCRSQDLRSGTSVRTSLVGKALPFRSPTAWSQSRLMMMVITLDGSKPSPKMDALKASYIILGSFFFLGRLEFLKAMTSVSVDPVRTSSFFGDARPMPTTRGLRPQERGKHHGDHGGGCLCESCADHGGGLWPEGPASLWTDRGAGPAALIRKSVASIAMRSEQR